MVANSSIIFSLILHLNPINLILKFFIVKFEIFTSLAINIQKFVNHINPQYSIPKLSNTEENKKLRMIAWITSTEEDDKDKLREMFLPT